MAKRDKKPPKHIQMDELAKEIRSSKVYNTCSSCKDVHEVSNTPGDYGCPSCGFTLNIKQYELDQY